ncbi:MAG: RHS repeat protein [Candidatus Obscuribacter sp.]|nr:RHS repeat protein [Candidatus Obscuribacter sp.]
MPAWFTRDGSIEAWTYDAVGNVLTHTNRGGAVTTMTYDNRNRMGTRSPDGQPTVTFTYDNAGRLLKQALRFVSEVIPSSAPSQRLMTALGGSSQKPIHRGPSCQLSVLATREAM